MQIRLASDPEDRDEQVLEEAEVRMPLVAEDAGDAAQHVQQEGAEIGSQRDRE